MNRAQRYIINGAILSVSAILIRAISVSFNIYLTSKIGAEGMGLITLVMSVYGFFITLATSGINLAVTNLISASYAKNEPQGEQKRILKGAITYALIFSVTASLILLFSARSIGELILKDGRCIAPLRILAFTLPPIAVSSVMNGYFTGKMQIRKNVAVSFTEQIIKISLSCIMLTFMTKKTVSALVSAVMLSGALSEGMSLIIYLIIYLRQAKNIKNPRTRVEKRGFFISIASYKDTAAPPLSSKDTDCFSIVFSMAFPVGVGAYVRSALASVEHIAIPRGLARALSPSRALASYGILHGMVFPLLTFPSAILGAFSSLLVPELSSDSAKGERARISRIVSGVMWLSLFFSLGVSGIFISFSGELGVILYNSAEAAEYIRLLAPLIPLMYLDSAVDAMLKGLNQQLYCMRVNIVDSVISIILILTLLPTLGIRGYIAVVFITELLNMALSILRLLSITGAYPRIVKWVIKPTLSIILSTCLTRLVFFIPPLCLIAENSSKGALAIRIAFCASAYLLLSFLMGAISKADIKRAGKIMDISTLRRTFS